MLMTILFLALRGGLFGYASRRVSEYRGEADGFWWGFWLGLIGLLIVIFRKSADGQTPVPPTASAPKPVSVPSPKKMCWACGAKNNPANSACFACGKRFEN